MERKEIFATLLKINVIFMFRMYEERGSNATDVNLRYAYL